jgi:hypothetical protein
MLQYACCALLPGSWWKRLYLFISVFASIIFLADKKNSFPDIFTKIHHKR